MIIHCNSFLIILVKICLKNIIKFKSKKPNSDNAEIVKPSWFIVSYVPVSEKFNRLNNDIRIIIL